MSPYWNSFQTKRASTILLLTLEMVHSTCAETAVLYIVDSCERIIVIFWWVELSSMISPKFCQIIWDLSRKKKKNETCFKYSKPLICSTCSSIYSLLVRHFLDRLYCIRKKVHFHIFKLKLEYYYTIVSDLCMRSMEMWSFCIHIWVAGWFFILFTFYSINFP